ncbi:hypothetical protein [Ralstonia pseudosolanacearum]|uniref:hypothetical protein n=1 Tax=Ralstonia pseudosolanacearum TaxID=1310165 RepID=UPI0008D960F0|nr:hypothetical protein [Ralstonia pseudosolanacearum]MCL1618352.1 hypothetical protein [Ralstonia pseudosolanacearum CaRs-Mep]
MKGFGNRIGLMAAAATLGACAMGAMGNVEMAKAVPTVQTVSIAKRKRQLRAFAVKHTIAQIRRQGWTVAHGKRLAAKARNRRRNKRAHGGC